MSGGMRLALAGAEAGGARAGALAGAARPGLALETPAAALLARGGSVVHLTGEVLARLSPAAPQLLLSPLAASLHLAAGARALGAGLARFCGAPQHVWCVCAEDPAQEPSPPGHVRAGLVPLWTRRGKQMMSAQRYMDLMETFRPDVYVALCDAGADALTDSRKRHSKAVDRSNAMLDVCVQRHRDSPLLSDNSCLLGGVVGWGCAPELQRSLAHVLRHADALGGVALVGLPVGEHSVPADVARFLGDTLASVPAQLVVMCSGGVWSPACALEAVARGCDLLDAGYATRLADSGHALAAALYLTDDDSEDADHTDYILHMDDTRYKEELGPLVRGCACAACARYSRAYVHHLRRTGELLASVLLSLHNLHQYRLLLAQARRHVLAGTFRAYKAFVQRQETRYRRRLADLSASPPAHPL